jgi:hypothetical protein
VASARRNRVLGSKLSLLKEESGTMKVQDQKVQEQLEIRELAECELDAVKGGFFGRVLAPYKEETYLTFTMSNLMVGGY